MQALEIGDFRLIARLDQGLKPGLDEAADTAAQDGLLAEEVGDCFLRECGLYDAGLGRADALRVAERPCPSALGAILVNGQQGRGADASLEQLPDAMARRLGCNHRHVNARRRNDLAVMDIETVREHQRLAVAEVRGDGLVIDLLLTGVRDQHHDNAGSLCDLFNGSHFQAVRFRLFPRLAAAVQTDHDVCAAVLEI